MQLNPVFLLVIPLSLSAFTHIWNPAGFPDIFFDEGVYLGRALHVLDGLGPQERAYYYDHPYFGQIFLAAVFKLIGYPGNMLSSSVNDSIESLYATPRILMGVLAIIDTFLIYKMTERRYNTRIAFLAAILFAVMPMSWFTRRIMLDSILLPFLLSSILFAVWLRKNQNIENALEESGHTKKYNKMPLVLLSGIFLGFAIFTKIPVVVMIPLGGYLIYSNSNQKWRTLGIWLVPVILIPLIWPAYSIEKGDFQYWLDTAIYQATRSGAPLIDTLTHNFTIDPVLYILFFGGLILAALRKNWFIILWSIPYFIFLYFINWAPYTTLIPLIPVFCISSAILLHDIITFLIRGRYQRWAIWSMISVVGIFGLISTTVIITLNLTTAQFQTLSYVTKFFQNDKNAANTYQLVSSPIYSWIFNNIYKINFVLLDYYDYEEQSIKPDKTLLIADGQFHDDLNDKILAQLYNRTHTIKEFKHAETVDNLDTEKYPYTSLDENNEGMSDIEVRLPSNDKHLAEQDGTGNVSEQGATCIKYDKNKITVMCKSAGLSDVDNELNNSKVLRELSPKIWILNANLTLASGSSFYINNTDTNWLKINSTSGIAHSVDVQGNMSVDSVKITSWDSLKNDYATTDKNGTIPRSYIMKNGEGTFNITNSEVANLGYIRAKSSGLTYATGTGSTIKNNRIHDLWGGILINGNISNVTIENNEFYRNGASGIDLRDKAHDFKVINNKVHDNGMDGIVCSIDCKNVVIESNTVYNNKQGVTISKKASASTITNNTIYNNTHQVAFDTLSNDNKLSNNSIGGGDTGIKVTGGSLKNLITDNDIKNSTNGIYVARGASDNLFNSNKIINTTYAAIYVKDNVSKNNTFKDNTLIDNQKNNIKSNFEIDRESFINNTIVSSRFS